MSIPVTYGYDDLYQKKVYQLAEKRPMRGEKSDADGPEKQIILFVWPNPSIDPLYVQEEFVKLSKIVLQRRHVGGQVSII
jgi:hypothetical protein